MWEPKVKLTIKWSKNIRVKREKGKNNKNKRAYNKKVCKKDPGGLVFGVQMNQNHKYKLRSMRYKNKNSLNNVKS